MSKFAPLALFLGSAVAQQSLYGQCGGADWTGATACAAGATCATVNAYYAQCTPDGTAATTTADTGSTATATVTGSSITATALTQLAGVNIAGFDFGCTTDGTCPIGSIDPPLPNLGGGDGPGQMTHFYNDDKLNIFRLPVGWQYLVNNDLGGPLNQTNLATYDTLVQDCLSTGAYCIVDIHNYARWNGEIIGQGGPTNEQFASVWSQLGAYYANTERIWFA